MNPLPECTAVLAVDHGLTKRATRELLERFLRMLTELAWEQGRIAVPGFGVFEVYTRRARHIALPPGKVRGYMLLPATRVVRFRASKGWRNGHPGRRTQSKLREKPAVAPTAQRTAAPPKSPPSPGGAAPFEPQSRPAVVRR